LMRRQLSLCKMLTNVWNGKCWPGSVWTKLHDWIVFLNFLYVIAPQKPKLTSLPLGKVLDDIIDLMQAEFKCLNIKVINRLGIIRN
jgi:hypothetical protein